jgi:DNA repair protein RadC
METNIKHLNIKSLAEDDRPREKLETLGRSNLSDAELIAIILGSGNKNETAVQLSQRILSDFKNDLNVLAKLSLNDLKKYKGIGTVKAINLIACFELGRRRKETETTQRIKINTSKNAFEIFNKKLGDLPHEEFWILILNRANQIIKQECISKGGITGTVVDIRIVTKLAIENNASGIMVAHNHPSGNLQPSTQDIDLTKKLKEALHLFDVSLIDHIIVGDSDYYSFADKGIL